METQTCDPKALYREWHRTSDGGLGCGHKSKLGHQSEQFSWGTDTKRTRARIRLRNSINQAHRFQQSVLRKAEVGVPSVAQRFRDLSAEWKLAVNTSSSITEIATHPAYQRIIGLGTPALPYILRDLEQSRVEHWFWALKAITGEDPVKPSERGRMRQMAAAWLSWAVERGLKW